MDAVVTDSSVSDNVSGQGSGGGGIAIMSGSLWIANSEFNRNASYDGYGASLGAALMATLSSVLVEDSTFAENYTPGTWKYFGGHGAVYISDGTAEFIGTSFYDNITNELGYVGGLYIEGADAKLDCSAAGGVWGNVGAVSGGAFIGSNSSLTSVDCDWGSGTEENLPYDVTAGGYTYAAYGADTSFNCTDTGCG